MSEELKEWYNTVPYEEIKNIIRDRMSVMAREYVGIGFYLRRVRDNKMYLEDRYKDVHEFAMAEFGMSRSTVNHCIRINEQFSVDGNSPTIDSRYKDFSKSQLQEMLYLPGDKLDEVTPDMTIKEIRGLKADRLDVEPETDDQIPGQMSIEDYPECMPGDEVSTDGSDQTVTLRKPTQEESCCLECDNDCNSRCGWLEDEVAEADSETDNNVNIDMGNVVDQQEFATEADENVINAECLEVTEEQPKRSDTILTYLVEACIEEFELDDLFAESGDADIFREDASFEMSGMSVRFRIGDDEFRADFNDDIYIRDAKTEKELDITFRWDQFFERLERIGDIGEKYAAENAEIVEVGCDNSSDLDDIPFSRVAIRDYLEEEERTLAEYEEVNSKDGGLPLNLMMRQRMLVKALRLLMQNETVPEEDDEPEEQEEPKTVQPELPILKNNDQRKAFLDNYQTWPVWFEVPEASEVYHRFDLPDSSSIVICKYNVYYEWKEKYTDESPHGIATREYLLKPGYHYLHDCLSNRTALVEHLKEVQKK